MDIAAQLDPAPPEGIRDRVLRVDGAAIQSGEGIAYAQAQSRPGDGTFQIGWIVQRSWTRPLPRASVTASCASTERQSNPGKELPTPKPSLAPATGRFRSDG